MLSVSHVSSAGNAVKYYAEEKDNYYVLGGLEAEWVGKGAEGLGLIGKLNKDEFKEILTGQLHDEKLRAESKRTGLDLTFSAPKSVSVLSLIGNDKRLIEAHQNAVKFTLSLVQENVSTRTMIEGKKHIEKTGNMVAALFLHDTSRELDPQLHTHAVIANLTKDSNGNWKTLSSDSKTKSGFYEYVYSSKMDLGKIYRGFLRNEVEKLGYETKDVGKKNLWEIEGVPTEIFSKRSKQINLAVEKDASQKSKEIAALDTRKSKTKTDPVEVYNSWINQIKSVGFDAKEFILGTIKSNEPQNITNNQDYTKVLDASLSILNDKGNSFTYDKLLTTALGIAEIKENTFEEIKKTISHYIEKEKIISVDSKSEMFTSYITLLDDLSVRQLSDDIKERSNLSIIQTNSSVKSRQELVNKYNNDVILITTDAKNASFFINDKLKKENIITLNSILNANINNGNTVIVDQADTLKPKDAITILDMAIKNELNLVLVNTNQKIGSSNVISIIGDERVTQFSEGENKSKVTIKQNSTKEKNMEDLAKKYVNSLLDNKSPIAQISGDNDKVKLNDIIRDELKKNELIDKVDTNLNVLVPVWASVKELKNINIYRENDILEHWDAKDKIKQKYTLKKIHEDNKKIILVDRVGNETIKSVSTMNGNWKLLREKKISITKGDQIRALGNDNRGKIKGGMDFTIKDIKKNEVVLENNDTNKRYYIQTGTDRLDFPKVDHSYVNSIGVFNKKEQTVFAILNQRQLSKNTLNQLNKNSENINIFTRVNEEEATYKLGIKKSHTEMLDKNLNNNEVTSETHKVLKAAINIKERNSILITKESILSSYMELTNNQGIEEALIGISDLVRKGELIEIKESSGYGSNLLITKENYEHEKNIISKVATGINSVTPILKMVEQKELQHLTDGQKNTTLSILTTSDRFIAVQGYAGTGKTTQYKTLVEIINKLPENERFDVIGLAPTHRAVEELNAVNIKSQTIDSFLVEHKQNDIHPDYSRTLFLIDEASMVGSKKLSELHDIIDGTNGRAATSGDKDQFKPIETGQSFRLLQDRTQIKIAVMNQIVRQTPELKDAIYKIIDRDLNSSLNIVQQNNPELVPRQHKYINNIPNSSIQDVEKSKENNDKNIYDLIAEDYLSRTLEAREKTAIITFLNSDRDEISSRIHDLRQINGEIGKTNSFINTLSNKNIDTNVLKGISGWEKVRNDVIFINNDYYKVDKINVKNSLINLSSLSSNEKTTISPVNSDVSMVSIFENKTLKLSKGDLISFNINNKDLGIETQKKWEIIDINDGAIVIENNGVQSKIEPEKDMHHKHIDYAYTMTTHKSQGASYEYIIGLVGADASRKMLANFESAYVMLSRAKTHVQLYSHNVKEWIDNVINDKEKNISAHDIINAKKDIEIGNALRISSAGQPFSFSARGRKMKNINNFPDNFSGKLVNKDKSTYIIFESTKSELNQSGIILQKLYSNTTNDKIWDIERFIKIGVSENDKIIFSNSINGKTVTVNSFEKAIDVIKNEPDTGIQIQLNSSSDTSIIKEIDNNSSASKAITEEKSESLKEWEKNVDKVVNTIKEKQQNREEDTNTIKITGKNISYNHFIENDNQKHEAFINKGIEEINNFEKFKVIEDTVVKSKVLDKEIGE
ncbi:conjugative relaxase [Providencia sp. wls1919]|nr:conjugative relaxase [Providencia sp. wls1919]